MPNSRPSSIILPNNGFYARTNSDSTSSGQNTSSPTSNPERKSIFAEGLHDEFAPLQFPSHANNETSPLATPLSSRPASTYSLNEQAKLKKYEAIDYVQSNVDAVASRTHTARNAVSKFVQLGAVIGFMAACTGHIWVAAAMLLVCPLLGLGLALYRRHRNGEMAEFRQNLGVLSQEDITALLSARDPRTRAAFSKALEVDAFLGASPYQLYILGLKQSVAPLVQWATGLGAKLGAFSQGMQARKQAALDERQAPLQEKQAMLAEAEVLPTSSKMSAETTRPMSPEMGDEETGLISPELPIGIAS